MSRKSVRNSDDSMANLHLSDSRINCASSTSASTGWNKSRNSKSSRPPITSQEAAVLTQGNVFSNQSQGMQPVHLNANSKVRSSKSSTWVSMATAKHYVWIDMEMEPNWLSHFFLVYQLKIYILTWNDWSTYLISIYLSIYLSMYLFPFFFISKNILPIPNFNAAKYWNRSSPRWGWHLGQEKAEHPPVKVFA